MESFFPENLRPELEHGDWIPWFEAHEPRRSGRQPEPANGGPTGARSNAHAVGPESILRTDSCIVVSWRANHSVGSTAPAVSTIHHGGAVSQQCRAFDLSFAT